MEELAGRDYAINYEKPVEMIYLVLQGARLESLSRDQDPLTPGCESPNHQTSCAHDVGGQIWNAHAPLAPNLLTF